GRMRRGVDALEDDLDEVLLIDGVLERLAHRQIVEWGLLGVDLELGRATGIGLARNLELGVLLEPIDFERRDLLRDLDLAGLERRQPGGALGDQAEADPIEIRRALVLEQTR